MNKKLKYEFFVTTIKTKRQQKPQFDSCTRSNTAQWPMNIKPLRSTCVEKYGQQWTINMKLVRQNKIIYVSCSCAFLAHAERRNLKLQSTSCYTWLRGPSVTGAESKKDGWTKKDSVSPISCKTFRQVQQNAPSPPTSVAMNKCMHALCPIFHSVCVYYLATHRPMLFVHRQHRCTEDGSRFFL